MNIDKLVRHTAVVVLLLCVAGVAFSQSVTLTPAKNLADGKLVPVLTWSSSPIGPTSCTASGGWSGTKAGAGTETLPEITASATYALTCSWPSTAGVATVTWTAPTQNSNGTPLTNLARYDVVYGTSLATLGSTVSVTAPATSAQVPGLASGTWYFGVYAVNTNEARSALSNVASKVVNVVAPTATDTANITIRPVPAAPVLTTVVVAGVPFVPVFRVADNGRSILSNAVQGLVPAGRTCGAYVATYRGSRLHRVSVRAAELWPLGGSTKNLAAPCS